MKITFLKTPKHFQTFIDNNFAYKNGLTFEQYNANVKHFEAMKSLKLIDVELIEIDFEIFNEDSFIDDLNHIKKSIEMYKFFQSINNVLVAKTRTK